MTYWMTVGAFIAGGGAVCLAQSLARLHGLVRARRVDPEQPFRRGSDFVCVARGERSGGLWVDRNAPGIEAAHGVGGVMPPPPPRADAVNSARPPMPESWRGMPDPQMPFISRLYAPYGSEPCPACGQRKMHDVTCRYACYPEGNPLARDDAPPMR